MPGPRARSAEPANTVRQRLHPPDVPLADEPIDLSEVRLAHVPKGAGGIVLWALPAVALLAAGSTTVVTVEPEEEDVVLRFGRYQRTVEPGLHFKLPSPIETVFLVPTQRQLKEEFGFRTLTSGVRSEYDTKGLDGEKLMLTGDLDVAVVEWIAQYRVSDPKYLFKVTSAP